MRDTNRIRILVTGSRTWRDKHAIAQGLGWVIREHTSPGVAPEDNSQPPFWAGEPVTVVHGDARGADTLADRIATGWGLRVERYPVRRCDWETCGPGCDPAHRRKGLRGATYCPAAANRRNQRMVDLGAEVCLAYPLGPAWSGTRDCMRRANAAGIRVVDWPQDGARLLHRRLVMNGTPS